jgi:hypothetical protein
MLLHIFAFFNLILAKFLYFICHTAAAALTEIFPDTSFNP